MIVWYRAMTYVRQNFWVLPNCNMRSRSRIKVEKGLHNNFNCVFKKSSIVVCFLRVSYLPSIPGNVYQSGGACTAPTLNHVNCIHDELAPSLGVLQYFMTSMWFGFSTVRNTCNIVWLIVSKCFSQPRTKALIVMFDSLNWASVS